MNRKLLGATIAAVFAISSIGLASAALSWQGIDDSSVVTPNSKKTVLTIEAADIVPDRTDSLVGFGWFYDSGPNTAFTITQHRVNVDDDPKNEVRDSTQNPDGWHPHNVILGTGAGAADACIAEIVDAPNAGISIDGELVTVNARNSILTGDLTDISVAFTIIVEGNCPVTLGTEVTEAGELTLGVIVEDIEGL